MPGALVLYATREGQTAKVAARIAETLRAAGPRVVLIDAADGAATDGLDPGGFDLLVFGASMHAGGLEREIVNFLNAHKDAIRQRERSFFLVLLSVATADPALRKKWLADARAKLESQIEVAFDEVEMIAGALAYSKYRWPLKGIMRRIAKQAGGDTDTSRDYEYTDWDRVDAYARRLAGRLDRHGR